MERDFCVEALQEALRRYGRPKIFNTDQGSQFTSEAKRSIGTYFEYYNSERRHQRLDRMTPDEAYFNHFDLPKAA